LAKSSPNGGWCMIWVLMSWSPPTNQWTIR
jgi:hypothetical protein